MTDLEKDYVRSALVLLEDDHIDAACALLEMVVAEDDVMATHFLAMVENGKQTGLKLIDSNIQPTDDGVHLFQISHSRLLGTIPPVVVVVK